MVSIAVISRESLQTQAFMKSFIQYNNEHRLNINAILHLYKSNLNIDTNYDYYLLSPEIMIYQKEITKQLEDNQCEYFICKPVDFGLKNIEKILKNMNLI